MRFLAYVALLVSLGAAAFAGQAFWQEWQVSYDPVTPRTAQTQQETGERQPPRNEPQPPRRWPLLFGEKMPPLPPKPDDVAEEEPQPPPEKAPPIEALGYTLKGVVRADGTTWAMVSHPTGDEVLRVGDELAAGMIVARIDEQGLWAGTRGSEPALLGFPE